MISLHIVLIKCISINLILAASLQATSLKELLEKMNQKEQEIKNIKFEYTQHISFFITKETHTLTSSLIYEKPHNLLIEYIHPQKQTLLADKDSIKIYYPHTNQLLTLTWNDLSSQFPIIPTFFPHSINIKDIQKRYKLELKDRENFYMLEMRAKQKKIKDYKIELHIDKSDFIPFKTIVTSKEFYSHIELKNWKINVELPPDTFKLKLSENVKEIKF